jgi:translation initiation factor 2B subunit (eIF-2B alpha/beta/delta family)
VELTAAIEAVRKDNISGAQSITNKAGSIVRERIRLAMARPEGLKSDLLELGLALIDAQPAMASLFNLFNGLLIELDDCLRRQASPTTLSDAIEAFSNGMDDHNRAIAERLYGIIRDGASVFTHSDSSTLRRALRHSHDAGRRFSVFCTESRPACEGSRLAQALSAAEISTCLTTDSLIFALLQEQKTNCIVLVGADAVTARGIINKAGTLGLAAVTRHWKIPFYVLAGSEKFLPAGFFPREAIQNKPPEEILASSPAGLRIVNRYFDLTPLDSITAVISEEGIISPGDLVSELHQRAAHPDLLAALQG